MKIVSFLIIMQCLLGRTSITHPLLISVSILDHTKKKKKKKKERKEQEKTQVYCTFNYFLLTVFAKTSRQL